MFGINADLDFTPIGIAALTVSDTRTAADDTSGDVLVQRLQTAGHRLADRAIVPDEVSKIQAMVQQWVNNPSVNAIISTGGTGLTGRDVTPEAVRPLYDKEIEGFSIIFHHISFQTVGLSTLQSRATAGVIGSTFIFCLPGSNGAVKDGWDKIISQQLDSRYRPCNLVDMIPRLQEI